MNMKRLKSCMFMGLLLAGAMTVNAQDADEKDYKALPYMFVGVQGGVQNTFNTEFNNLKTFTPTMSLSFGRMFSPVVGARLHFNGVWDKSGVNYPLLSDDGHYKYNYVTGSLDALVNLCTLFGKKDWYPVKIGRAHV